MIMNSMIVPFSLHGQWINTTGELANPRLVFVTDRRAGALLGNLEAVRFDARDQLIVVTSGRFAHAKEFLSLKAAQLLGAKAIVFLWFGQDEISQLAPDGYTSEAWENYFHELGPRTFPRSTVADVLVGYGDLVGSTSDSLQSAAVFTTDPCVMRTHGFGVVWANDIGRNFKQQNERHHHFCVNHNYHGRKGDRLGPGGKFPIHEDAFIDGVIPSVFSWRAVFASAYAVIGKILDPSAQMNADAIEALSSAKIKY